MENFLDGKSYFENKRNEFLSKYQNKQDTNLVFAQQFKNKKATSGGTGTSMGLDIPTDTDEIIK